MDEEIGMDNPFAYPRTNLNAGNGTFWRILLIDDDEDDFVLFNDLLSEARTGRFQLDWVSNYPAALETIRSKPFDVILVDFSLGGYTGTELIQTAVSEGITAPFILVTGHGSYEVDLQGMQAGAADYLNKLEITGSLLERSIRYAIKQKNTERALAEANAALRQSRQEVVEILESISDGFLALDRGWRFLYINHRAAHNGRREPEDLIGKEIWEEFSHLKNSPHWEYYHQVMEHRQPAHFEFQNQNPESWYSINVYPTEQGISVYWLDITPQKRAEQALAGSLRRLSRLIDISGKILAQKTVRGVLQIIVDAACDLTGAQIGTSGHGYVGGKFLVGVTSRAENYDQCPPGENFTVERGGVYKLLVNSVNSIRLTKTELYNHPDWWGLPEGHAPLNGLLGVRLVDADGNPNGLILVSDKLEGEFTTEDEALLVQLAVMGSLSMQHIESCGLAEHAAEESRRNAEQAQRTALEIEMERARLEAVLQQMPAGVIIAEAPSGKMLLGNQRVAEIFGTPLNPAEDYYQYKQLKGFHPDGRPYQAEEWPLVRSILYGEVVHGEEIVFQRFDDNLGTMLVNSVPMFDQNGGITAAVVVFVDITEQRRLEARHIEYTAQMEVHRRLLEHREMERLQIARDLHDGPVQNLISQMFSIQHAISLSKDESVSEVLLEIRSISQQLVDELRGFFKELRPPTLVKFGLEKAIRTYAQDYLQKNAGLHLQLDLTEDKEMLPSGIRLALYRIYQESLNNIARHARAKAVEVQFGMEQDRIVLEIRDDGAGFAMPNDWVELARQGHLGLVGMKERAEAVGGTLKVSSIPGRGTLVRVEVPWTDPM